MSALDLVAPEPVEDVELETPLEPSGAQPRTPILPDIRPEIGDKDELVLGALDELTKSYGASEFTYWDKEIEDFAGLPLVFIPSENPSALPQPTQSLARECLEQQQVCCRIISARSNQLIVAAPVPGRAGVALTVQFPFERHAVSSCERSRRESINLRCRDVVVAAAYLGIVRAHDRIEELEAIQAELQLSAEEPRWKNALKEIGLALWAQLSSCLQKPLRGLALMAVIGVLAILPWPYSVRCNVTCEPFLRRYVAAPFDAKLLESKILPGDNVEKGQLLAILDGSELRSQIASLEAQLGQATQRRAAALSTGDASNAELERLEVQKLTGEIDVLHSRIARLEIRSPISGIVVSGNLERIQGAPLSVGEDLFEIAPLHNLVMEIAIPESDISRVQVGMETRISLDAGQGGSHVAKIARIHPRSEMRDGQSVFVGEAEIENAQDDIRPGMLGQARVAVGKKPAGWILLHRPYEALRRWIGW